MQLATFMKRKGLVDAEVAEAIGVTRPTISRYRRRLLVPSWPIAKRLHEWSRGEVSVENWFAPPREYDGQEAKA